MSFHKYFTVNLHVKKFAYFFVLALSDFPTSKRIYRPEFYKEEIVYVITTKNVVILIYYLCLFCQALTMLYFTLSFRHVLKVVEDGVTRQVMKGLVPQLLVNFFFSFSPIQVRFDFKDHLPPHRFSTQQPRHYSLTVSSALVHRLQV